MKASWAIRAIVTSGTAGLLVIGGADSLAGTTYFDSAVVSNRFMQSSPSASNVFAGTVTMVNGLVVSGALAVARQGDIGMGVFTNGQPVGGLSGGLPPGVPGALMYFDGSQWIAATNVSPDLILDNAEVAASAYDLGVSAATAAYVAGVSNLAQTAYDRADSLSTRFGFTWVLTNAVFLTTYTSDPVSNLASGVWMGWTSVAHWGGHGANDEAVERIVVHVDNVMVSTVGELGWYGGWLETTLVRFPATSRSGTQLAWLGLFRITSPTNAVTIRYRNRSDSDSDPLMFCNGILIQPE